MNCSDLFFYVAAGLELVQSLVLRCGVSIPDVLLALLTPLQLLLLFFLSLLFISLSTEDINTSSGKVPQ